MRATLSTLLLLLFSAVAQAHPGHGSDADTLWHYLGEPVHQMGLLGLLLGVVAIVFAIRRLRNSH